MSEKFKSRINNNTMKVMSRDSRKTMFCCMGFLIMTFILLSLSHGVMPPEHRGQRCHEAGGNWSQVSDYPENYKCVCPGETTSMWDSCWVISPEESCKKLNGEVKWVQIEGPMGSSFKCKKNSTDITDLAKSMAIEYDPNTKHLVGIREQIEICLFPLLSLNSYILLLILSALILIIGYFLYKKFYFGEINSLQM